MDGYKLSDEIEARIEDLMQSDMPSRLARGRDIGRAHRDEAASTRYIEFVKSTLPRGTDLAASGWCSIALTAPPTRSPRSPCGSSVPRCSPSASSRTASTSTTRSARTAPDALRAKVKEVRADIGIALDGDADRVIIVDEHGEVVDGDQLMAVIAQSWAARGRLQGGGIVATVMSNLGLERYLTTLGLNLERTQVGDRYVLEAMRAHGFNIGGEQSGHIILSDFTTTGDGLVAGLQLLAACKSEGRPVSEICARFARVPQLLQSVRFKQGRPLDHKNVVQVIAEGRARLGTGGPPGDPRIGHRTGDRVMAESDDEGLVKAVVGEIAEAIRQVA